jgi:hypothetical protein
MFVAGYVTGGSSMRVFFHYRSRGENAWTATELDMAQVPAIGEYVTLFANSPWYKVQIVIHTPFEGSGSASEIFAVQTDRLEEQRRAMPDFP